MNQLLAEKSLENKFKPRALQRINLRKMYEKNPSYIASKLAKDSISKIRIDK
jgi:hypothetical protein